MGNDWVMAIIRLRPARMSDCLRVWRWRNEKEVRKFSFNTKKIPYPSHKSWFVERLARPQTKILIGENGSAGPMGQVRVNLLKKGVAEVHVLVKRAKRNRGFGQSLLRQACRYGFGRLKLKEIIAHIRRDNLRSVHAFERVGFRKKKEVRIGNRRALLMKLKKDEVK